jgi:3',5'-nucleoside bisphosphate phosphatase
MIFRSFRRRRNEMIVARVNRKLARENARRPLIFRGCAIWPAGPLGGRTSPRPCWKKAMWPTPPMRSIATWCPATSKSGFSLPIRPSNLVHRAGGIAVLAHPPLVTSDRRALARLLDDLRVIGLDGLEAYSNGACP